MPLDLTHPRTRAISGVEFLLAAAIVILHNVWHLVPNEVPILFVLALVSFKLRDGNFNAISLRRPMAEQGGWRRTILIALAAAILRIALGAVVESAAAHFLPSGVGTIKGPAGSENIVHDWKVALEWLALVWTFAALGEEISYRGYIFTRCAEMLSFGNTRGGAEDGDDPYPTLSPKEGNNGGAPKTAYWLALLPMAVLFGFGHYYKGPVGVLDSTIAGLILGAVYILSKRNFWACVLTHGFIDTIGVVAAFMGWAS